MKGILAGFVTGAVISGLGLALGERYLPVVDLQPAPPEAGEVAVPAGSEFNAERPDAPPVLPGTEAAPESAPAPEVAVPGPASDALPDTTPLDTPQAEPLAETALTPPPEAPTPVIVSSDEAGVLSKPELAQPDAPEVDAGPVPEETASLPVTGAVPASPTEPVQGTVADTENAPANLPDGVAEAPDLSDVAQPAAPDVDAAATPGETADLPQAGAAPGTPAEPVTEPDASVEPSQITALPQVVPAPAAPEAAEAEADIPPVAVPDAPQGLRLPVPQIEDMAPGVTTDRLPRIGSETVAEEVPVEAPVAALEAYAIPFERPANSPLIAIVMVDVGQVRPDASVLTEFPLPLTVALDPTVPDAGALMQAYRAAGLEVAILTPLPEGAAPADVEVAFQSFVAALPEAVAVMDLPEGLLQESRPRAAQVVEILAETGHGLITYDRGLNPGIQIAGQMNIPAATVFRDIDPGGHDVAAMKRFLDQAAFRAGQGGRVILKAEARPETLTALAEWILGTRAATVAFAPVSAVLLP